MAILKVVEILAESVQSWEDAAKQAVEEATRTLRNVRSIYIENMQATVEDGKIDKFRLNAKITFALDGDR